MKHSKRQILALLILLLGINACSTLPFLDQNKAYSRIFLTDFGNTWSAALESVADAKEVQQNRDQGTIETGWIPNSASRNFIESFSAESHYRRSRYRLFLYVREGIKAKQTASVVRIQKEQQVQKSPFAAWESIESTGVDEAAYLYRIGRLVALQEYAEKRDEEKTKNFKLTF